MVSIPRSVLIFLFLIGKPIWAESGEQVERFAFSQIHMGVVVRLILHAPDRDTAEAAARAAFDRMAQLEFILSDYRENSEIRLLPSEAHPAPRQVSEELFHVLQAGQNLAQLTNGTFDMTAAPLTLLWREARRKGKPPDQQALREARERTGWQWLVLDESCRGVRFLKPGMGLDSGGLAKGYAGDEVLKILARHGIFSALYQAGGDVVAGAPPPGESGWPVRLFQGNEENPSGILFISHAAISTSGDTEQFLDIGGIRHSHILDPQTGMGVNSRLLATVLAPDGITADGLATLATAWEPEKTRALMEGHFPGTRAWIWNLAEEEVRKRGQAGQSPR